MSQYRPESPGGSILIVEDDDDLRTMLETMLSLEGYTVVTARNGLEGLTRMRLTRPSLILLDLMMPVMDGETFRRHQLADPTHASIPTLCLSARHDVRHVSAALRMNEYLQKPLDDEKLLSTVARYVTVES